jgi:hypothetical protein
MASSFRYESPLQAFLRNGGTLEELQRDLGIKCKRHPKFPNLILFVYDQIDSPKLHPIVRSARGHILDENNEWMHVCRPPDRFFNWGEAINQGIDHPDISKSIVFKKEDGSLVNLWHYNGEWHVSTKGSPDAGGNVGDLPITFADLFWSVWNKKGLTLPPGPPDENAFLTYSFELCTLSNRIVCSQPIERLLLIAVRDNFDGKDHNPKDCMNKQVEICESYELDTFENIKKTFEELAPLDMEGYVITQFHYDGSVIRTKVKHPGYLALAHMKEGVTQKSMIELIRLNDEGEFLLAFPEYKEQFDSLSKKYDLLVCQIEALWEQHKDIVSQKDFALAVKDSTFPGVLFNLRRRGGTVRSNLISASLEHLQGALSKIDI